MSRASRVLLTRLTPRNLQTILVAFHLPIHARGIPPTLSPVLIAWWGAREPPRITWPQQQAQDRKSTRLNSSHSQISYAVFCLKKKKQQYTNTSSSDTESLLQTSSTELPAFSRLSHFSASIATCKYTHLLACD